MRQEVYNTEQTTHVEPEDLKWLGTLTASSRSSSQPLLRCLGCCHVVLSTSMPIHRRLCDPSFLKTAATERPIQHTLAVPLSTVTDLVKRGSSFPKETNKANKKQRPELLLVEMGACTNLSKVNYTYQTELSLLEDFMSCIIDRFVFPQHLRRRLKRKGRTRRGFIDSATLALLADEELASSSLSDLSQAVAPLGTEKEQWQRLKTFPTSDSSVFFSTAKNRDQSCSFEMRLIMEYCDGGSLRQVLRNKLQARRAYTPAGIASAGRLPGSSRLSSVSSPSNQQSLGVPSLGVPSVPAPKLPQFGVKRSTAGRGRSNSLAGDNGEASASAFGPDTAGFMASCYFDMDAVILTALDIAKGMQHQHQNNILHADLKPANTLIKCDASDPRGFVVKVADFGLALRLEPGEDYIGNVGHGTPAHQAPETSQYKRIFPASDVFSFGLLMWELYTSCCILDSRGLRSLSTSASNGSGNALSNWRPSFPDCTPQSYSSLAKSCWSVNPYNRLTFKVNDQKLTEMLKSHEGAADVHGFLPYKETFLVPVLGPSTLTVIRP